MVIIMYIKLGKDKKIYSQEEEIIYWIKLLDYSSGYYRRKSIQM